MIPQVTDSPAKLFDPPEIYQERLGKAVEGFANLRIPTSKGLSIRIGFLKHFDVMHNAGFELVPPGEDQRPTIKDLVTNQYYTYVTMKLGQKNIEITYRKAGIHSIPETINVNHDVIRAFRQPATTKITDGSSIAVWSEISENLSRRRRNTKPSDLDLAILATARY